MSSETSMDETLVFAEYDTAVDSLEQALRFAQQDNPFRWKWIVLALDNALYTAALSCLSHFIDFVLVGTYSDKTFWFTSNGHSWLQSYKVPVSFQGEKLKNAYRIDWDRHSNPPAKQAEAKPRRKATVARLFASEANLIGFWTALARVQDKHFWMRQSVVSCPLKLDDEDMYWVWCLHERLRNPFTHCKPGEYGIPIQDMSKACSVVSYAATFLLCDSASGRTIDLPEERRMAAAETYRKLKAILKPSRHGK